jgi:uncharacterized protein (TIGR00730 family)
MNDENAAPFNAAAFRSFSVGVFCGAQFGNSRAVIQDAREVGSLLGSNGYRLIYGAGGSGIMGTVASAAVSSGSTVTGVIPHFLLERERGQDVPPQETIVVKDMFDRKRMMLELSDAFLGLAGGCGTLDEILEVITFQCLEIHYKTLILLDSDGIWTQFTDLVEDLRRRGFITCDADRLFRVAHNPREAIQILKATKRQGIANPPVKAGLCTLASA